MEPEIRYVKSADGTNIAYANMGSGPPLMVLLSCFTNMELEWRDPEGQAWVKRLADGRQLIRCEHRGCGASQRDITDLSLDAQVADLAAVADHLHLERFDLFGAYDGAAVAATYCARYPQRVPRLVLWAPFARGMDIHASESFSAVMHLMLSNWPLARRTWGDLCFPSGPPERVRWYNDLLRQSVTPELAAGYMEFMRDLNLISLLEQMQTSTLVLCRDRDRFVPAAASRAVAALLPNATFGPLEGDIGYAPFGDISYLDRVERFLDEGRARVDRYDVPSGTAVILFADIADSTALTERLGDAAFRAKARELDSSLRTVIRDHAGTPIEGKLLGDGVLAVFTSARQAIEAALGCGAAGSDGGLPLHLGLHADDVIREENNVYGGAVNIASRISGLSAPGEVLVSDTVRSLARTSAGVRFEDRGEQSLKGVGEAVRGVGGEGRSVMEPRIQYARTSDGVNIAFSTVGDGRSLMVMPPLGFNHAELIWEAFGAITKPLAEKYRLVSYDARGSGLSDRSAIDFSMEAMIRDLEAVVERSRFESFVLASWGTAVPIAVTYAVAHPEHVSHLIFIDGCATFSDFAHSPVYKASVPLLDADWVIFTEAFAQVLYPLGDPEVGPRFAEFIRACCEPEAMRALWKAWESRDVTALLPSVTTPTLIVHNKNNRWFPVDVGQRLAAAVPNARLTLIDDMTYAPVPNLIDAFVGVGQAREPALPYGTVIILFADIVDSTTLTERLGDAAFRAKARDLDAALRTLIRENNGTPIEGKLLGDGVLAVFTSARQAIEAALACAKAGAVAPLPLHLGLHAGDVIREENNVYGGAVNIAARISGLSAPGEILVSETVRSLARTSAGVRFEDGGEQSLKGVGEPVRVWAVRDGR